MTLHLHRAERADRLVTALGDLLSTPLPDPFATEIISVPTPGVEVGCRRAWHSGSAPRLVAATAYVPAWTSLHLGDWWRVPSPAARTRRMLMRGNPAAPYGRSFE